MQTDFTTLKTMVSEHSSKSWDFIKYEEFFHWLRKRDSATKKHFLSHNRQLTKRRFPTQQANRSYLACWHPCQTLFQTALFVLPSVQMYQTFIKFDIEKFFDKYKNPSSYYEMAQI